MTLRSDNRPWYKQRWPWLLMAGPIAVVIAGVITTWLAVTSNDGLVTDDYYKQGLAVNQTLQRDHQASSLGIQADVMRAGQNMRLLIRANEGVAVPQALELKLAHPTRAGQDQSVAMTAEGQGFYSGKLTGEVAGRWLVSIEDPAGQWRLHGEWQADSEEPLRLTAQAGK
ncbi:FixH family protein [Dechloromonas sp. XY25]|uniref:FixH family protein n=1 Tax=Dechloromonas hankyongensis TaxID=2908002 RepID=A0ABS9K6L7_9RHOO|nr:FixH family protein [Dechloromonas hankyongensis]MCG2578808.1 FixH family protein [Dechloromonas hankyongensis]